jgi:pimeloyl-ACP methyl ester carboxylesterase
VRANYLFSGSLWLPLRYSDYLPEGEEVEFVAEDGVRLRGLFISSRNEKKHGTILFCHELNGNRSNIAPYAEVLLSEGFNIFTFDFRNHGKSDIYVKDYPAPWLTASDMFDVRAAIEYVCAGNNCNENSKSSNSADNLTDKLTDNLTDKLTDNLAEVKKEEGISIFGLGKGAAIALCAAGSDSRVKSIVLDAPTAESQLFNKNCWQALIKAAKLSKRRPVNFYTLNLFIRAVFYSARQLTSIIYEKWQRYILGLWYDCQFIDIDPIIKKVNQPIMIVYGHVETKIRPNQIRAFCERMPQKTKLWLTAPSKRQMYEAIQTKDVKIKIIPEDCRKSVADFVTVHTSKNE